MPLIEEIFSDDEETGCDVKKSGTQKLEVVSSDVVSSNDPGEKMVTSPDNSRTDLPHNRNTQESVTTDCEGKQADDVSKKIEETNGELSSVLSVVYTLI